MPKKIAKIKNGIISITVLMLMNFHVNYDVQMLLYRIKRPESSLSDVWNADVLQVLMNVVVSSVHKPVRILKRFWDSKLSLSDLVKI